ncbi:hypothetical protein GGR51DRAFT_192597 [Nemania sp. FL0031]|nr:hypothetical protein GGR51DRAFT_192597 [Nemania sp. FL0031]
MCATIIFQYTCGCVERVIFECPFSSITNPILDEDLNIHSDQKCSRRYRCHQERLLATEKTTDTNTTPPSHQTLSQSLKMIIPFLPPPNSEYPETKTNKEQKTSETKTAKLDDLCHDCWQHSLWLAKQKDENNITSSTRMKRDGEDAEDMANSRVLKEISVNEVILPRRNSDPGVSSSGGSFSSTG